MLQCNLLRRMLASLRCGAARHGLAHEWERLMTVEAAQLDHFAVELEAVVGEFRFAEADGTVVPVEELRPFQQAHVHGIQIRMFEIPQLDRAQAFQMDAVHRGFGSGFRRGHALRRLGYRAIALSQLDFERQRLTRRFQVLKIAVHIQAGFTAQYVFRLRADIFEERCRHDAQGNLAVDSAKRQVVDLVAEGRDVGPLGGIDIDGQNILAGRNRCAGSGQKKTACIRLCTRQDSRR